MFTRTVPVPQIRLGGAEVRLWRRLTSQIAAKGLRAASIIRMDLNSADVLDAVAAAHQIADVVQESIDGTRAVVRELQAVHVLLSSGEYRPTASPMLSAAESARGYAASLMAMQPDCDLIELSDAADTVKELADALSEDVTTAEGRASKLAEVCSELTAKALALSDEATAKGLQKYALPPVLADLVAGLDAAERIAAARLYQEDRKAAVDERRARRKRSERALLVTKIGEVWA